MRRVPAVQPTRQVRWRGNQAWRVPVKAWRWTLWSLFAWLLLIAAGLGGMLMWILAFLGDGLLFVILALLATGAFVYAVRLRHRLDTSLRPELDFAASEGPEQVDGSSAIARAGLLACVMLALIDWRARSVDHIPEPWVARGIYALAALAVAALLMIGYLLTGSVRFAFAFAWGGASVLMLLYFGIIGLFLPWSIIKRDPSLRSFLGHMGCKSLLGLRLLGVFLLAALISAIVGIWYSLSF